MGVSVKYNIRPHFQCLIQQFILPPVDTILVAVGHKTDMSSQLKNILAVPGEIVVTISFRQINWAVCHTSKHLRRKF